MTVSIAMTTYNGAKYLQEQLDSFMNQSRQPDELIVCDDGSTDATLAIAEQFAASAPFLVKIYRNQINLGCLRNFEKALSLCNGDYVFLSDQDDVWRPNKISSMLAGFESSHDIHMLICDADYTDENLIYSGATVMQKVVHVGQDKSAHCAGACTAVSKKFLELVLPFPRNCQIHDGYLHKWADLLENKLILDESLQIWRIHEKNTSDNKNEMTQPELSSAIKRYASAKDADSAAYYRKFAEIFSDKFEMLNDKHKLVLAGQLTKLTTDTIKGNIQKIIDANLLRAELVDSGWFKRRMIAVSMLMSGKYKYFKRHLSFAKDMLR